MIIFSQKALHEPPCKTLIAVFVWLQLIEIQQAQYKYSPSSSTFGISKSVMSP